MRFSKRTPSQLVLNPLAKLLQRKKAQGTALIDLTESNPTRVQLHYPQQEILQALQSAASMRYAPSPQGIPQARRAVADYYGQRGCPVDPDDVFLTASTSEAYSLIFKLLLNPGDELLAPRPGYPLIDWLARAEGLRVGGWPFFFDGLWQADLAGLQENVGPRTRLLAAVHPNNPTGAYLKRQQWGEIAEICRKYQLAVVCDEVFGDYGLGTGDWGLGPEGEVFEPLGEEEIPLFVLNGLSKTAGMPQMKLGWIVLRGPQEFRRQAAARLEFLADAYLSVGAPVQWAAARLLEAGKSVREQIRRRTRTNLDVLKSALAGTAACPLPVEGGWSAVVQLPRIRSEEAWALRLLDRQDVLVHPGDFFGFPDGCQIVLSLLPPRGTFREGVRRLAVQLAE